MPYPNDPMSTSTRRPRRKSPFVQELTRRCAHLPGVKEVAIGDPTAIPLDTTQHELNILEGHFYVTLEGQNGDQDKSRQLSKEPELPRITFTCSD